MVELYLIFLGGLRGRREDSENMSDESIKTTSPNHYSLLTIT